MPAWPTGLPDYVQEQGYSEQMPDTTIETNMDIGPAKIRRRTTTASRIITCTILMTQAQSVIFEEFYLTTLRGGSLTFDWVHPLSRVACTMRFRKPAPQKSISHSGAVIRYACKLEIMP